MLSKQNTINEAALLLCILGMPSKDTPPTKENPNPRVYPSVEEAYKIVKGLIDPFAEKKEKPPEQMTFENLIM